ncbi:MAG: hybrid sensor histidine kinase/response regulator [Candidatus Magnetomorum sp.]|nr:hybrid sensor histidine kinase/response regulator [Candidatus Magnetomorum sp.]
MDILIVEDEIFSRKVLQKIMESFGECKAVENGKDALTVAFSEEPPDLILLDIVMPGIDGYEVCRRLKANPLTKDIPVIFLSANTEVDDKILGFKLGAVDYIPKPFHRAEVKARVQTHLELHKARKDLQEKNLILEQKLKEINEKTEQLRQKDLQLLEMDRITGIGTLAAGIAHEINNPLGFIKNAVDHLKKMNLRMIEALKYWKDKPVPENLLKDYNDYLEQIKFDCMAEKLTSRYERVMRGIDRIVKIVNSLKKISGITASPIGKININEMIDNTIEILIVQEAKNIRFIKDFAEVPLVECYHTEINQCFLNVLKNAIDAMNHKNKGTIQIKTSYDKSENQTIIDIIDNGKGMSDEIKRQAFNPFFTTKEIGSGTGVGLSLTERIIKRHGGKITIFSKEGQGCTVTMKLPVAI